jgi:transposase
MKNSMLKGAHLSEGKSQDILRYFSEDLTATQIANLTGVSRVTVNNYFRTIRLRIARHCEEKNPNSNYSKTHSVVYLKKESNDYENGQERHQTLYGFHWHNGKVFASSLERKEKAENGNGQAVTNDHNLEQYKLQNFHAIADFKNWKLFNMQSNSDVAEDDIFCFWNDTKNRMVKFRGLHKNMLYLHVKECEFRYNYRNDDINTVLLGVMQKHFSIY